MLPAPAAPADDRRFRKSAGAEPLPGYRLVEPLGRGGFGEVWKVEAPGGLLKAVKFVAGDPGGPAGADLLRREYEAFEQVKAIRHPFLLTLERVEVVRGELVMVMELADRQLGDRAAECRAAGLPGVPRAELLGYLADAAEVLDLIAARHDLQHLDVKPANLFLVGNRVKVGDFGLVAGLRAAGGAAGAPGWTPRYAAPEVVAGRVDPRSDQYSLALVYQEMLTGTFPYPGRSVPQMLMMHAAGDPDLDPLPAADRPAVGRALSKDPGARFPSCLEFVAALIAAGTAPARPDPTAHDITLVRPAPSTVGDVLLVPTAPDVPPVRLDPAPVVTVAQLIGGPADLDPPEAAELAEAVALAACPGGALPRATGDPIRRADGSWAARFPVRQFGGIARLKLEVVREEWGGTLHKAGRDGYVVRRPAPVGLWDRLAGRPAGLEVEVRLPAADRLVGDAEAVGRVYGAPGEAVAGMADRVLPEMVDAVRRALSTVSDRRAAARVPTDCPVALYPLAGDGAVLRPVAARCRDVSVGGVCCVAAERVDAAYAYAAFPDDWPAAGWALLVRLLRARPTPDGYVLAGRYAAVG